MLYSVIIKNRIYLQKNVDIQGNAVVNAYQLKTKKQPNISTFLFIF